MKTFDILIAMFFGVLGVLAGSMLGRSSTEARVSAACTSDKHVVVDGFHFSCQLGPSAPGWRE